MEETKLSKLTALKNKKGSDENLEQIDETGTNTEQSTNEQTTNESEKVVEKVEEKVEKVEEKKSDHDYKKYPIIENPDELYPGPVDSMSYREDPEENVVWEEDKEGKKSISNCTLEKLIELLTSPTYYDTHMQHTFMLTFRSFTDQETLIKKLVDRFNMPPQFGLTKEEFAKWKVDTLDKIRLRISSTFKYWIENFYHFDFVDEKMKESVDEVVKMMDSIKGGKTYASIIQRSIAKAQEENTKVVTKKETFPPILYPPLERRKSSSFFGTKTIEVKPKFKNPILVWPSMEIARQLSLIDFENFAKIQPKECLNQSWAKGQRETKAPGICAMVTQFNSVSMWIGTVIVQATDMKERAEVIEKFIDIAKKLWELNNLNGVFTLTAGLALAAVYRLKKTWPLINDESKKTFEDLQKAISREGNFAAIRSRIKNVKPPAMPYIGIYLTDLTFIEDGNPKYVNGKINFVKCKCFAGVIRDMQTYQNTKYEFAPAKELLELLNNYKPYTEDEMFKASLEIEPKEPKKK